MSGAAAATAAGRARRPGIKPGARAAPVPAQRPGQKRYRSRPGLYRGFPPPAAGSGPPSLGPPRPGPSLSARPAAAGSPVGGRRSGPGAARVPAGVARPAPRVGLRGLRAARCAAPPCPSPPAPLGVPSFPGRRLLGSPAAPPASRSPAVGPPRPGPGSPRAPPGLRAAMPPLPRRGPLAGGPPGAPCGARLVYPRRAPLRGEVARHGRADVTRALRAGTQGPTRKMYLRVKIYASRGHDASNRRPPLPGHAAGITPAPEAQSETAPKSFKTRTFSTKFQCFTSQKYAQYKLCELRSPLKRLSTAMRLSAHKL